MSRSKRLSKYGNRRVAYDGYIFDSQAEHNRYQELVLLVRAGEINDLTVHPRFELQPAFKRNGKRISAISYHADFEYYQDGRWIVEDVKGDITQVYAMKRKMFLCQYPHVDFREVKA